MTVLDEVATYLAAAGVGVVGTTLFESRMPDSPDAVTAVIEYQGNSGSYIQEQQFAAWEKPRLQIRVRALDYASANTLIQTAYRAVDTLRNATLSGVRYLVGLPLQPPFLLERDALERTVMCFNAEFWRTLS